MRLPRTLAALVALVAPLAGCLGGDGDAGPFPPTDAQADAPPVARAPGVTLHVRLSGGGDALRIHAEAANGGEETLRVPSACVDGGEAAGATQPFSVAARRPGSATGDFPVYPARGCSEVLASEFRPGERRVFEMAWNGTFWSRSFEQQTALFPGEHVLDVAFEVYAGSAAEPTPLVATVPFTVR